MMELWALVEGLGVLITLESKAKEVVHEDSEKRKIRKLKELSTDIDFSTLPADFAYCVDKVERYFAEKKKEFLGANLFSEKERSDFIDNFFSCNMDVLPYKDYIEPILIKFLNRLEKLLLEQISVGDTLLYQRLRDISEKDTDRVDRGYSEQVRPSYTANALYAESFRKELFLHKGNKKVTLANLFVMQDYKEFHLNEEIKAENLPDLPNRLANFIQQETRPFLFIEGDAGSGKSTLISWMNHHADLQDDVAKKLLDSKPLVTIRLRDLDKRIISGEGSLIPAILSYMRLCTINNLEDEFPEAVVVLDGFDELCMIDQITNYEELLYDLGFTRN